MKLSRASDVDTRRRATKMARIAGCGVLGLGALLLLGGLATKQSHPVWAPEFMEMALTSGVAGAVLLLAPSVYGVWERIVTRMFGHMGHHAQSNAGDRDEGKHSQE